MILHVDMDAFYASVEERDDPKLRGKTVIVGGTPEGRGVVAAANYVVRKFGVHIRNELNLVASVGVAPNKFLAKLASDMDKPNGFTLIELHAVESILAPLSVARIWGVGKVTQQRLDRIGIQTIGQLRTLSLQQLQDEFGQNGEHFWQLARGIDNRVVIADREAKSISHETTFAEDICDMDVLRAWLQTYGDILILLH